MSKKWEAVTEARDFGHTFTKANGEKVRFIDWLADLKVEMQNKGCMVRINSFRRKITGAISNQYQLERYADWDKLLIKDENEN